MFPIVERSQRQTQAQAPLKTIEYCGHQESLVETQKNYFQYLDEQVIFKKFEHRHNKLHIRAAILKRLTLLIHPQMVAVE